LLCEPSLEFLKPFINLEELSLFYSSFYGLEHLCSLTKLKTLDIRETDIDSGLEYLPESLETIWCGSVADKKNEKLADELLCGGPGFYMAGELEKYDYQA